MKIVKQQPSLNIENLDFADGERLPSKHGSLFPSSIRCCIIGPSNCGKTNVMISLLIDPNGLRFQNVYVYSKSLNQPKYQFLKKILKSVKGVGYYEYSDNEKVLLPSQAKNDSVIILDDVITSEQSKIQEYFCMGRHKAIDSFYLSQTYAKIPKHLIRDNINMLVIFKQDTRNLKHVYADHVETDMSYKKFVQLCRKCWSKNKYGFLVIMKDFEINKGRYRQNFDSFIHI